MKYLKKSYKFFESKKPFWNFRKPSIQEHFQSAKEIYDKIYLNIFPLDNYDDDYGFLYFEFIAKNKLGWWLLAEDFMPLDKPYDTYEELQIINGLTDFEYISKFDITNFKFFKNIEKYINDNSLLK